MFAALGAVLRGSLARCIAACRFGMNQPLPSWHLFVGTGIIVFALLILSVPMLGSRRHTLRAEVAELKDSVAELKAAVDDNWLTERRAQEIREASRRRYTNPTGTLPSAAPPAGA